MTKIIKDVSELKVGDVIKFFNENDCLTYSLVIHDLSTYGNSRSAWAWNISDPNGPAEFYLTDNDFYNEFVRRSTAKPWSCGKELRRQDGFEFRMLISPNARKFLIVAGCQRWDSFEDMTKHYTVYRNDNPRSMMSVKRNKALNTWSLKAAELFKRRLARRRNSLKKASK